MRWLLNILIASSVVTLTSWLSRRFPITAGFIVALPLTSMMVLPFSYLQHGDAGNTFLLAKSIFAAVPITMAFFVPFLLAGKLHLSFWQAYGLACVTLCIGFAAHRLVAQLF